MVAPDFEGVLDAAREGQACGLTDLFADRSLSHAGPRWAGGAGNAEDDALDSLGTGWAVSLIRSALSAEQADVIILRVIGDLDVSTVSRIVGKQPGTVRVIQHRALRRLARALEGAGVTQ